VVPNLATVITSRGFLDITVQEPVTVIVIHSLSYTGTTWLNCVLGAHPRCFALGPPDRVYRMLGSGGKACRVHGDDCVFWPGFLRDYDIRGNFFLQLAQRSGRDVIVTNNALPDAAGSALRHPDIVLKPVYLIRDGRALAASYRRHVDGSSYFDAITNFLTPSFQDFYFDPDNTDKLCLRYEDVLTDPLAALSRMSAFVGIDYDIDALRFWEHAQHLTAGNAGTIGLIRIGQQLPITKFHDHEFYAAQFRRMQEQGPAAFEDTRWMTDLTVRERFLFDVLCGTANARFGYTRDRFTLSEVAEFGRELRAAQAAGELASNISQLVDLGLAGQAAPASVISADSPCIRGLREQLSIRHLARSGLHLNAAQTRRLGGLVVCVGLLAVLVLVALV
jgi:hypothetical protein